MEIFEAAVESLSVSVNLTKVSYCEDLLAQLTATTQLPDLILLDVNIPAMGGLECLTRIKQNPLWAEIPVIMYSTSNFPKHVAEAFEKGAWYYLSKPIHIDNLISTLESILAQFKQRGPQPDFSHFLITEKVKWL